MSLLSRLASFFQRTPATHSEHGKLWVFKSLELLPKPFFLVDYELKRVVFSNAAARTMLGLETADHAVSQIYGKDVTVYDLQGNMVPLENIPSARVARREKIDGEEIILETLTGRYNIKLFSETVPAMFGIPEMGLILFQDITALKKSEQNLKQAQADLNEAVETAMVGFWSVDTRSMKTTISEQLKKQFDVLPGEFDGDMGSITARIHEEDRERVANAIRDSIASGAPYKVEYRVEHRDGSVRWIEAKGGITGTDPNENFRFSGTTLDITERVNSRLRLEGYLLEQKILGEKVADARVAAERANSAKSQFLANMSHEIRTPLGAIIGFTKLIKDEGLDKKQRDEFIAVIERNSSQLLRIIDDILDLSKVEAGMMLFESIEFSLPDLLSDFTALMGYKARQKGVQFTSKAVTPLPQFVFSDPTRVRQILMNVVGNAIKFTDQGYVELRVKYTNGVLEFEVEDTGRGISDEQANILFQPFTQADASTTRKYGGTGLGLSLTRSLAEALGGSFELKTSELGRGSTFVVHLKAKASRDNDVYSSTDFESRASKPIQTDNSLSGVSVLLVEDAPDNQALITVYITRGGAKIDIAADGEQGYRKAVTNDYDVVLMDVQMPVMDGITAVKKLRADNYQKPIIALTAHAMKEERERCIQAGFSEFLTKPVSQADLLKMIKFFSKQRTQESATSAAPPVTN